MGVLETSIVIAGAATVLAGVFLGVRGVQVAHVRFMAAWCVLFGAAQIAFQTDVHPRVGDVLEALLVFSIIAFALAYPGPAVRTHRKWLIVWLFIPALAVGLMGGADETQPGTLSRVLYESMWILALFGVPAVLGWRAIRTRSALARDQVVWLIVPLTFWTVHDSWRFVLPALMGFDGEGTDLALIPIACLFGFALVATAALVVGAWSFRMAPEAARSARTFALAVPIFVAMSFIQFSVPPERLFPVHSLMDTMFALLLFYGIARYGVVDLRLRMRWSVKQGTIAAAFVAVFFLVSESASTFLSETSGSAYLGIGGAALMVFALAPLQRFAERLSVRAVPMAGSAESYLQYRRLHIYRAALEGALADGRVDTWETDALRALRHELAVSDEEHRLLESELGSLTPKPAAA